MMGLSKDGCVWAWGSNTNGQLGTGSRISCTSPECIVGEHCASQGMILQKKYVQVKDQMVCFDVETIFPSYLILMLVHCCQR